MLGICRRCLKCFNYRVVSSGQGWSPSTAVVDHQHRRLANSGRSL